MLKAALDNAMKYVPSINVDDYYALVKAKPAAVVGFVMLGAAGVSAYLWNQSAGRIGLPKTRGKVR